MRTVQDKLLAGVLAVCLTKCKTSLSSLQKREKSRRELAQQKFRLSKADLSSRLLALVVLRNVERRPVLCSIQA